MKNRESRLVLVAIELIKVGERLDHARNELKLLVENGSSYQSGEIKDALQNCAALELQWKTLEQQYLALRKKMM